MTLYKLTAVIVLGFSLSSMPMSAQTRRANLNQKPSQPANNASRQKKSQRAGQQRQREAALAALRESGDTASLITDRFQQAQTLATIAELLWKHDEATARSLFARAWTVATAADRESAEATQSDASASANDSPIPFSDARDAVLVSAARCDDELAQRFLREREKEIGDIAPSSAASGSNSSTSASSRRSPWGELSPAGYNRLALARTLLEEGETRTILPLLLAPVFREGINAATIEFLLHLRRRDASDGDKLYATMLHAAPVAGADANSVLLAGAYLISPTLLTVVDANGGLQLRHIQAPVATQAVSLTHVTRSPAARRAFADFAVGVLSGVQIDANSSSSERVALLFALERTLPFLARENSAATPGLRERRDALAAAIELTRREQLTQAAGTNSPHATKQDDSLRLVRGQIRSLPEGARRDAARLSLVRTASRHHRWADARLAAVAITDVTLRHHAETLIRKAQIARLAESYADATQDDFRRAARFVEESDVPPLWKSWGYAQAAQLAFRRGATEETRTLLDDAAARARATAEGTDERIAAWLIVTTAAQEIEPRRTPESLSELVRTVNANTGFDGEFNPANPTDAELQDSQRVANNADNSDLFASPFDSYSLERLFDRIAQKDFPIALAEARNIERPLPRSLAIIGIARATLKSNIMREPKPTPNAQTPGRKTQSVR